MGDKTPVNDTLILQFLDAGRLRVVDAGTVLAPRSNTPDKPCGALTAKGYLRICLTDRGRQCHFMAHRVVWLAHHRRPVPPGHSVDHLNGVKTDNRIENLEVVPVRTNTDRARRAGAYKGVGRRDGIRDERGRFGKKAAGSELDGRTWNEMPEVHQ